MALPLSNTFEGGTDATAISTSNSGGASGNAFDLIGGTAPKFSATQTAHGGLSMVLGTTAGDVEWTSSVGTPVTLWGRCYFFATATPSANCTLAQALTPTSPVATQFNVRINTTTYKLAISTKGGTVVTSTTTLSANTWYRVEFKFTSSTTTCTTDATLYVGDSTTATETLTQATAAGVSTDTSVNAIKWGNANGQTASSVYMDDIQINSTGFPGPFVAGRPKQITNIRQAVMRGATW